LVVVPSDQCRVTPSLVHSAEIMCFMLVGCRYSTRQMRTPPSTVRVTNLPSNRLSVERADLALSALTSVDSPTCSLDSSVVSTPYLGLKLPVIGTPVSITPYLGSLMFFLSCFVLNCGLLSHGTYHETRTPRRVGVHLPWRVGVSSRSRSASR